MVWLQPVSIYDLLVYLLQPGYAYKDICEAIEYSCYNWHIAVFFKVPHMVCLRPVTIALRSVGLPASSWVLFSYKDIPEASRGK